MKDSDGQFVLSPTRMYNSESGAFLSRDPASGADVSALYQYTRQNPVTAVDPDGRAWNIIAAGIGGAISFVADVTLQAATQDKINWRQAGLAFLGGALSGATGNVLNSAIKAANDVKKFGTALKALAIGTGVAADLGISTLEGLALLGLDCGFDKITPEKGVELALRNGAVMAIFGTGAKGLGIVGRKIFGNALSNAAGDLGKKFADSPLGKIANFDVGGALSNPFRRRPRPKAPTPKWDNSFSGDPRNPGKPDFGDIPKRNYIYRGIHGGENPHPSLPLAKEGTIVPGDINGKVTPELHNQGGHTANSPYTSWTHDRDRAISHAEKGGAGGIVVRVPSGGPPKGAQWRWAWSPDVYGESEVLLHGIRTGVEVLTKIP